MISLAWATAQIRQPPMPTPAPTPAAQPRSWFEPPASATATATDWDAGSAIARPAPAIARPALVIDPPAPITDRPSVPASNRGLAYVRPLLLIAILTVQALLSLRLVWSNSAYVDEATYLWAGHLEIAQWLHGGRVPPFQTWFSGAPVIYPPIGALADSAGGLAGARILSLACMTGVTALAWNITSRLFDSRAAFFAAALFAALGPTHFLGALATYDAMALLLMAMATWCVVAARDHADSTLLLVAGAVGLMLANATKYATVLFDPVVIILAALIIAHKRGVKSALGRGGYLAASVSALVAALLATGGPSYLAGVMYTTAARATGDNPPAQVLEDAWKWAGVVCALAWLGIIVGLWRGSKPQTMVLSLLAAAGMLAPLSQARIHTITSLHKHVDFGAWLAAPAAGYALAQLSRIGKRRALSLVTAGMIASAIIRPVGFIGWAQASSLYHEWPASSRVIATLRGLTRSHPGNYLAEDYDIPAYYLQSSVSWQRWSNTWYFSYKPPGAPRPLTGAAAYRAAIARHYFSLVILDFGATRGMDNRIAADLRRADGYQIVAVVPSSVGQYTIWAYQPQQRSRTRHDHR